MLSTTVPALRRSLQPADRPDRELLRAFVERRDGDAFADLVHRHGPAIYGVCRRTLGDSADADDAFQATFLVLIRKASLLSDANRVGSWLYGVAVRISLDARRNRRKRWDREGVISDSTASIETNAFDDREILDTEIARLSEPIREAVLLCELEGLNRYQASQRLGIPEGTLSSRLAAGRKQLALRLAKRGLAPAILLSTAHSLRANVPYELLETTCRLANGSSVSTSIHTLAKDPIMTGKLKFGLATAAGLLLATAIGFGGTNPKTPGAMAAIAPAAAIVELNAGPTVKEAPPVVVKTSPSAGSDEIDASKVTEIRVTFSKEMMDQSWSWASDASLGEDPDATGDITYDKDKKTCIMPVKLKPGTTYALWINSGKFANFKDADGKSAVPYLLVFQTKK